MALHKLIAADAPRNRWMKTPPGLKPGLAGIDPSLVVQPPAGLELGWVLWGGYPRKSVSDWVSA